jgi:RNA polymerase sigma-70 factor, ECF subfamily
MGANIRLETGLEVSACVERVGQRDEEAARTLLEHLHPLVLKLVRAHLPRRTSEEDLVQTVFMKVFANLESYSGTVPLEHWVSRITVNTCLNQIQKERARPELRRADLSEEESHVIDALAATDEDLDPGRAAAAREIVEKLLERLEPPDRLVITLLYLEGHSVGEVHKLTGWNTALIKVRAFRARQKLKKHFHKLMSEYRP